jgi:2-polyprenyl-3-methyl-5-hydroxy-6-metoxy-1,4-benzoquinol methylase
MADTKYDKTYFSGFWRNYRGRKFHLLNNFRTWYILRRFKPRTVLDVGCGMGLLIESLGKRGVDIRGIDLSSYALSSVPVDLRSKCSLGNIASLDFPDESFDVVVSVDVLEHLGRKEIQNAVRECLRVARNGVYFEITVREDLFFINSDPTHISKYRAKWWFDELMRVGSEKGWKIRRGPTIPILRHGIFVAEK